MNETTQTIAADFGSAAIGVKEHELRGHPIIDRHDQSVGADSCCAIAPSLRKFAGTFGHRGLEPQQEVITESVQLMKIMALHSSGDVELRHDAQCGSRYSQAAWTSAKSAEFL
jgi:hypothetical protein